MKLESGVHVGPNASCLQHAAGYFTGTVIKYCTETDNYEIVYDGASLWLQSFLVPPLRALTRKPFILMSHVAPGDRLTGVRR